MKKILIGLLLLLVIMCMSSCKNTDAADSESAKELEQLVVFYDNGAENILTDFKQQYPEYDILMKNASNEEKIEQLKLYYGEPDIILRNYNIDKAKAGALEVKYGCDLSGFIQEDASIEDGKYFPGTFNVCRYDDEILAIPLGVSLHMMILSEENWLDSAFAELEDGYTGKDLLDVIEYEIDHEIENEKFLDQDTVGISYHMLQLLGGINENDGAISIDEDLYAQLYNIWYKGMQNLSTLDPEAYEGKYRATIGYRTMSAPQMVLSQTTSEKQHWDDQDIYAVYFPAMTDGTSFGACVQIAGMVGKNSENKEQAYEFLRLLMDTPVKTYSPPRDLYKKTFCPVNVENAYALMDEFESATQGTQTSSFHLNESYTIDYVKVSDREREKLQHVLENITFLYREIDEGIEADKILEIYKEEKVDSYEESYLAILNLLNEKIE